MNLRGKLVAITGAGSGIGRALAVQAGAEGAQLALSDVDGDAAQQTLKLAGAGGFAIACNVQSDAEVAAFAVRAAELGGAAVLFNNAGVSLSAYADSMKREDFMWLMDVNFWGVVRGTEAFLPQLRAHSESRLVNISSIFGIMAVPSQSAYHASKFAVRGYTECVRQELRETAVRVCCVHPGGVRTNIVRNGKHYQNSQGQSTDLSTTAALFDKLARLSPEQAASIIWRGVKRASPRILVGNDAKVLDAAARFAPARYDVALGWLERKFAPMVKP
jgi:NAD(P)-dependent dehydrogenase (short-subunit alcohol dehydrogenase family)